jgi:glyoxylase-like metal-dependent hydrolase (beta-lactamase superfamily II)
MNIKYITEKIFAINDGNDKSFTTGGAVGRQGTILFGCDDRLDPEIIRGMGLPEVAAIFCCDYRRSANSGILNFEKAEKYANENYCGLLSRPEEWWENPKNRWHLYKLRNDGDILAYGASNVKKMAAGERIEIGGIEIEALHTPGDTDHSMSYIVEDGGKKIVFCGGLLYKGGKIPYVYRLTQGIHDNSDDDYHGFLHGIPRWKKSLEAISCADLAVPYLGGSIETPREDIAAFCKNIDELYERYADIAALNYYFDALTPNQKTKMGQGREKDFPAYIRQIGNQCNVLRSKTGGALAIDCGGKEAVDKLLSMIERGEINGVEALYITHYHDDHVDGCGYFRERFACPIYADKIQADILKNPINYRLPCISPVSVDVTALGDGYFWRWHEFELTSFFFPGQTLYHDALLAKNTDTGEAILFAGDSFTPTGIDDYCAYNRNLLITGEGYFRCLDILEKYMPDYIINQHVGKAFDFTSGQLGYMRQNLFERMRVLQKLSVWDDINISLDEYFAMAYPYEQHETDNAQILIGDYARKNIKYEIVAPKRAGKKSVYGVRIYAGDVYLGQKACFMVNND